MTATEKSVGSECTEAARPVEKTVSTSRASMSAHRGRRQVSKLAGKMRGFNWQRVLAANVPAHFASVLGQAA